MGNQDQSTAIKNRIPKPKTTSDFIVANTLVIYKSLGTLQRYTPVLSKTTPFFLWHCTFRREMDVLSVTGIHRVVNLKYWVVEECFRNWSEYISDEQSNDINYLVDL